MRRLALLTLGVAVVALAGCDLFQPPADRADTDERAESEVSDGAFRHRQTEDVSGFYTPVAAAGEGNARLLLVFIGQTPDFETWETGPRDGRFAPVMLEFAGGERVLPDRYEVADDRVRFWGDSDTLGRVTLDARLDAGSLALARRNLGPDNDPAMEGTVTAGGQIHTGVKFAWSLGGG